MPYRNLLTFMVLRGIRITHLVWSSELNWTIQGPLFGTAYLTSIITNVNGVITLKRCRATYRSYWVDPIEFTRGETRWVMWTLLYNAACKSTIMHFDLRLWLLKFDLDLWHWYDLQSQESYSHDSRERGRVLDRKYMGTAHFPYSWCLHTQKVKGHSVQQLAWKQTDVRRRLHYPPC